MAFRIQRVPRGLNNLLNIFGGGTPVDLEDRIRGTLELLQMYGTTQLQSQSANTAAAVEGAGTPVTLSQSSWTVLFMATGIIVKTATMTALRGRIAINRVVQNSPILFAEELGPFGATETGNVNFGGLLPYPLLCPPGTIVSATPEIIGTDANANVTTVVEFGVLG